MTPFRVRRTIAVGVMAVIVGACSDATGPASPTLVDSLQALPRALTVAEREGVVSGNAFALSLLRDVASKSSGNVLLSPFSVWTALGMTMNGAAAQTETEMRETLGWGARSRSDINTAYRDLAALLPTLDPSVVIRSANGIWVRNTLTVDAGFASDVKQYFGADVTRESSPRAMFDAVNAWGNAQTNGLVPRVLQREPPEDLLMLLANAVLFDGGWRYAFDPATTRPGPFYLEGSNPDAPVAVPTMQRRDNFRAMSSAQYFAVELPYGNSAYSMLVVVPTTGTVNQLVAAMDSARLASIVDALAPTTRPLLLLPKFTVSQSVELSETLTQLGMPRAFTDNAEFPRLFGSAAKIGFVQHGVTLEVNERGTRGAAVTVVGMVPVSLPANYAVDRPFVFFIRERFTGAILFNGVVRDPRS